MYDYKIIIVLIAFSVLVFMIGLIIGHKLGRVDLWNQLRRTKKAHDGLDLRYDPDKKEISLNGTHRIPAVVFTKEEIFKVFPKKYAKKIFKKSKFGKSKHFD